MSRDRLWCQARPAEARPCPQAHRRSLSLDLGKPSAGKMHQAPLTESHNLGIKRVGTSRSAVKLQDCSGAACFWPLEPQWNVALLK